MRRARELSSAQSVIQGTQRQRTMSAFVGAPSADSFFARCAGAAAFAPASHALALRSAPSARCLRASGAATLSMAVDDSSRQTRREALMTSTTAALALFAQTKTANAAGKALVCSPARHVGRMRRKSCMISSRYLMPLPPNNPTVCRGCLL